MSQEVMKCLSILFLKFLFLFNLVMAETLPTKSDILKQTSDCFKDLQTQICQELVSDIEKLQIVEFDQNRFKCQSSLLGLQSEIIETYFFKNFTNEQNLLMIPYVIKNC